MDHSTPANNKFLFYEDLDDGLNSYKEARYYFNNISSPIQPNRTNSFPEDVLIDNSKNLFKMKLRSTVADSKFIEQSSYNLKSKYRRDKNSDNKIKNSEMFDISYNDANYTKNVDTDSKGYYDRNYTKRSELDKDSQYSGNEMFDTDINKEDSDNYDINYFGNQSKNNCNIFSESKFGDKFRESFEGNKFVDMTYANAKFGGNNYENCYGEGGFGSVNYGENKHTTTHDNKFDPSDLVSSLRDIANKIEFNDYKNTSKTIKYEDHIIYLNNKIAMLNDELKLSHKKLESTKSKMDNKIAELESHIRQLISMMKENGCESVDEAATEMGSNKSEETSSITFPSITVEFSELDQESKLFSNKLMRYLYADINDSETSQFMPRLYKALRQIPKVVECKQVIRYITDCIRRDAQKIHSRLSQNTIFSEEELFADSPFGLPQSNAERQVVSELESTLQFSSNAQMTPSNEAQVTTKMGSNVNEDFTYTKTHVIMNRSVLCAIFKATNMNNLYNYLFEALNCDNFRVVETINQAVCSKFMDLQLAPRYASKVRHPLMWSFGPNYNSNQAYRYMKMINYNFDSLPTDPTTGDNLWHMVAKGNGAFLAQKLKSFSIYTQNLNKANKDGKSPLDISTNFIKREFYVNLIVDLASKGSEMYKKTDYDKALEFYNDAINYQSQLINNRYSNDNANVERDSANYYRDNSTSSSDKQSGRDNYSGSYTAGSANVNAGNAGASTAPGYRNGTASGRVSTDNRSSKEGSSRSDNYDLNMGKLYYNKARTLMHLNRWVETIEYCELCLKHIPNYYNAYDTCIRAHENLLDWESAAKTCLSMRDNCGLMDERKYQYILDQRDATFFQLLDIDKNASQSEIKKAFNTMCKIWHPDKNTHNLSEDIKKRCVNHFNRLFEAREKLMDPTVRALQQVKRETNYIIPTPYVSSEKPQEIKDPQQEPSPEFDACETAESNKFEQKDYVHPSEKKTSKSGDPKLLKSRDNLNELTMERLKFMDSMNLLKGQVLFDYDSFSWGQL